jgi:hypothetical protein
MKHQPTCVCVNLRRLARATTQLYDDALAASGIKVTQYSLLCAVEREQPVAISALGSARWPRNSIWIAPRWRGI